MPNLKPPAAMRPVGCAMLALFAVLLWLSCLMLSSLVLAPRERRAAASVWTETPCVIQKLGIEQHSLQSRTSGHRRQTSSTAYSPQVTFEYELDGQTYTSDVFWLGGTLFNTREEVEEIIRPFQEGGKSACYVNPQDPHDAVLSRQLYDENWVGWMMFIPFGLIGAAGCAGGMWAIFFPRGWGAATQVEVVAGCIAALAWNGLFGTLFVRACLRGIPWSDVVGLLGFPIIGVLLAAGAILKTRQYWMVARSH